ncbi:alanine aminotransferase [Luteitalea sp. TBR-22]|uniref:pyridoxal phosphate-dependent aminotransferase n=1 Tax=Luteitalea sp. TBR-22 TaxID=2802971 RepID=UPI001AFB84F5|nr:aminotransferase class I/II-fold pyridoxal phosphate-dependent enzyme [Luteitalea sp. TBR-22]BCS36016.1 alanine aminotransferase [Luteitalea sp. TBR-22]
MALTSTPLPVADRVNGFSYAIRNIVVEAKKVEAAGRKVAYLNIGDPIPFGFVTPPHLVEAVAQAMRDGHNGYTPSPGILHAREAVADDFRERGLPVDPDRVLLTSGTSEGIELTLTALLNAGDEVLVPTPTYPLYTAVIAKLGAVESYYRTDPARGWLPDLDHLATLVTPRTRALVVIDPNNPTGAVYPPDVRRALVEFAEKHGLLLIADEVYADLAYDGPVTPLGLIDPDAAIISYSSLSKAYLAPGWRAGWMAVGRTPRLDGLLAGLRKLADGRLCSPGPMQYGITAALRGDRSFQDTLRAQLRERADITTDRLNAIDGITCVRPTGAFYAMPQVALPPGKTDVDYVLGLLRATGVLTVFGSGFGTDPAMGAFRVVFLAPPADLHGIYDRIAAYTSDFLAGRG